MLLSDFSLKVMLYREACDMRKSIDGLSQIVADTVKENPTSGGIYVFINKSRDKLKLLYWDRKSAFRYTGWEFSEKCVTIYLPAKFYSVREINI